MEAGYEFSEEEPFVPPGTRILCIHEPLLQIHSDQVSIGAAWGSECFFTTLPLSLFGCQGWGSERVARRGAPVLKLLLQQGHWLRLKFLLGDYVTTHSMQINQYHDGREAQRAIVSEWFTIAPLPYGLGPVQALPVHSQSLPSPTSCSFCRYLQSSPS